ncbi:MAG: virginiamycin B lyase, partial [Thermoleophilaceae bacterium]
DHGSWGVASGKDGNLWVTDSRTSQIARITPDGEVTEFGGLMG